MQLVISRILSSTYRNTFTCSERDTGPASLSPRRVISRKPRAHSRLNYRFLTPGDRPFWISSRIRFPPRGSAERKWHRREAAKGHPIRERYPDTIRIPMEFFPLSGFVIRAWKYRRFTSGSIFTTSRYDTRVTFASAIIPSIYFITRCEIL